MLTGPVLKELLGAGWQTVSYRQNTELMIEAVTPLRTLTELFLTGGTK